MRRRTLLTLFGATGFGGAGLAWYTSVRPQPSTLVELEVVNYDDSPHTVEIRVSENSEVVYGRSIELEAAPTDIPPKSPVQVDLTEYPTEPGQYTIRAWLSDRPEAGRASLEVGEYDARCLGLRIHIGGPDQTGSDIAIWRTTESDNC